MTTEARTHTGRGLVWVAAAAGVVHAAFSLYWALGGTWLLATVGRWAVDLGRDEPALAGIALGLVTLVKLAAALVPVTGVTAAWILWSRRRPLAACFVTLGWMALQMSGLPWRLVS